MSSMLSYYITAVIEATDLWHVTNRVQRNKPTLWILSAEVIRSSRAHCQCYYRHHPRCAEWWWSTCLYRETDGMLLILKTHVPMNIAS